MGTALKFQLYVVTYFTLRGILSKQKLVLQIHIFFGRHIGQWKSDVDPMW